MWTLHAGAAGPALTRLYRHVDCAGGTLCDADRTASRRPAPDRCAVRCPLLAASRAGAPSLAPYRNFLVTRRVHSTPVSHPLGLGVRCPAVPVRVPDRRGALVLRWLRDGGVAQPSLPA